MKTRVKFAYLIVFITLSMPATYVGFLFAALRSGFRRGLSDWDDAMAEIDRETRR